MNIELIRIRGDRTQEEMAEQYGVKQQTWSQWETGKAKPKYETMKRIARDANSTVDAIFFI